MTLAPLWQIANSNFSAALFGALAGALAAHVTATRTERKHQLLAEISGVNNAIALTNTITNSFLAIKRQHVIPLVARYSSHFLEFVRAEAAGGAAGFKLIADFRTFPMPLTPIAELRETILTRVQSSTRAISISIPLHQCIDNIEAIIARRDEAIKTLQAYQTIQRIDAYFGLRDSAGNIDERYPDLLLGMLNNTDDIVYFSMLLSDILTQHGSVLVAKYGRRAPHIVKLDYSNVASDLLPDRTAYPDYEAHFRVKAERQTLGKMLSMSLGRILGNLKS